MKIFSVIHKLQRFGRFVYALALGRGLKHTQIWLFSSFWIGLVLNGLGD